MKTVKAKEKQTVFDVALEQYGTLEALGEIMTNNTELRNDSAALMSLGIEAMNATDFYMDVALEPGIEIMIEESSSYVKNNLLKLITTEITTFDL